MIKKIFYFTFQNFVRLRDVSNFNKDQGPGNSLKDLTRFFYKF